MWQRDLSIVTISNVLHLSFYEAVTGTAAICSKMGSSYLSLSIVRMRMHCGCLRVLCNLKTLQVISRTIQAYF
uniref:Uncharacterized protein n=1 Tax=Octopus bimaculoides TaxID=37653 RepID=A0A0L8GAX1_OCTBM